MTSPLQKEFEYFLAHKKELLEKYNGQFIVIRDHKVIGAYRNELEAVTETRQRYELGTFLVQKVEPGDDATSQTFHSRVDFSRANAPVQ